MIQNNFYFYKIAINIDYLGFYSVKNIFYSRFRSILMSVFESIYKKYRLIYFNKG